MLSKQALWNTLRWMADILRDRVPDYKSYILSLLFFKRLSDNYKREIEQSRKDAEKRWLTWKALELFVWEKHDFKIPEGCFFEDIKKANHSEINKKLDIAITKIADENVLLKWIINAVSWNAPAPDGSGKKMIDPAVLTGLINYLWAVSLDNTNVTPDILWDAYEYLIKKFADENKWGTVAGQFYTPQEIVDIIVRYLKPEESSYIFDPTCGSWGMLIRSAKYAKEKYGSSKKLHLFGQELTRQTWAIANVNMHLHWLEWQIKQWNSLKAPAFQEDGNLKKFDIIVANFPFSSENRWENGEPKMKNGKPEKKKDWSPQLSYPAKDAFSDPYGRMIYGIPPFSNGDFAFIQHIIASLNETGRAGVVCPQWVLFRWQPEKTVEEDGQSRKADDEYLIRRGLLEWLSKKDQWLIEAIIALPSNLFYGTGIPWAIVFFNKNKPAGRKNKVLMVYWAKEGRYKEEPNLNTLEAHDVLRLLVQLESWGDIKVAKKIIPEHEKRLKNKVEEDMVFDIGEILMDFDKEQKELERLQNMLKLLKKKPKENKSDIKKLLTTIEKAEKKLEERDQKIEQRKNYAEKEKAKIDNVINELLTMFGNPELRKKYFAVVDMEEIVENEYNLNIPRYIDTFEPEEEIPLNEAVKDFQEAMKQEKELESELNSILSKIK